MPSLAHSVFDLPMGTHGNSRFVAPARAPAQQLSRTAS
eukprot:CAMPEP_0177222384 /NCGR_PEP_ID=MMETSP0367-20130122/37917_1 /TAXON_ID=447022 ORGANISM="Scrippsiella hangoei-like, Strain SHHI-4" /NCGR_SAMPLE_ID=MMETSP0367 /ASSEMBLY_ACC=CAM_ASM_000362 /LENGTH=37 /DNA_ID= /DNA_START= /DNA_END= /DNA_ORIENTATION=